MAARSRDFHPSEIPSGPGVYLHRDRFGNVIYVGKAKNLRRRLSQYFQPSHAMREDPRRRSLINSIWSWDYFEVKTEDEALILESRLIKEYAPYYNVLMRDDKRYLLLKLDRRDEFPTLRAARVRKDDGAEYFGPFPHGTALRGTLEFLLAHFGLRACRDAHPSEETRKHCLKRIIRDCLAPCTGCVSREEYLACVDKMLAVLSGDVAELAAEIEEKMTTASAAMRFEKAALLRDVRDNLLSVFGRRNRSFRYASLPTPGGMEAVESLAKALGLPALPRRIECFDISNILGKLAVASLVTFSDGRPDRARYRRFRIKTVDQSDDFAMMREAITRHYSRKLDNGEPPPELLMVDGGKGQLSSAVEALVELKFPAFPVIGLAKRNEEIFLPGRADPVVLDRHDPGLRLLQSVRDESHRFAITYHRELRQKRLSASLLDDIAGIGPARKNALLSAFGSVRELRKATPEELVKRVPGIGPEFAAKVAAGLQKRPSGDIVNENNRENR
ncbi:MAG: helix-hairpin-helix domain-containing protein [Victivallaceae bacterium]